MLAPWKKIYDKPRQHIKKHRHYFVNKGTSSQSYGFSSSHGWMWELDFKESWVPKNWCLWSVMLEKTLESPLDIKGIKSLNPKGNQSWIFIGRTDAKAETPVLWPPDVKNWLIGKDFDDGKDWRLEEKRMTEDEMVGWHHWLHRHEFEQGPGFGDGHASLACYSPWGHKELGTTEWLNWTEVTSFVSDSAKYGPYPTSLLCPWDSLGKNTEVGCPALFQRIFLIKDRTWISFLLHWQLGSLPLSPPETPVYLHTYIRMYIFSYFFLNSQLERSWKGGCINLTRN